MCEFKISEAAKRTERKRIRKNLIIISIVICAVLALFCWGFYGVHRERMLLSQYGKEVTAIYVDVNEYWNTVSDPLSGNGGKVMGYRLIFEYADLETGYSYRQGGVSYKSEAEAYKHIGETVQIIIYRNLCVQKSEMGKGLGQYGTLWLSLGISLTALTAVSIALVIIFRKKVFLTPEDKLKYHCLPD